MTEIRIRAALEATMKLVDALDVHGHAYEALGLPDGDDGIPEERRGVVFIGLATGMLLAKLHPEKAEELLAAMTLMRNEVLGRDQLWEDLVAALAAPRPSR